VRHFFLVSFFSLALLYLYFWSRPRDTPSTRQRVLPEKGNDWWLEYFTRLETVRPRAPRIKLNKWAWSYNWKPAMDLARPDLIKLSKKTEAALRASHDAFVHNHLPTFARRLPFDRGTAGIVTTAGPGNFGMVLTMLIMVRQAGSQLPVEIVLDASKPWIDSMCADQIPRLYKARCVYIEDAWARLAIDPPPPKFKPFQWKVIAMVASSFQNVLFMDADMLPMRNPDPIIWSGSQPFTSTGLITFADFWASTGSKLFYAIAGDVEVPPLTARATSESGVIVLDKARHADTLLLAAYYNYYGPEYYYKLLSQNGAGEGDKETYLHAAIVLEELAKRKEGAYEPPMEWTQYAAEGVKKGYWDVKSLPKVHYRPYSKQGWFGKQTDTSMGMFMLQMDPMENYRAVMEAIKRGESKTKGTSAKAGMSPRENSDSKPNPGPMKHEDDQSRWITDSTFLARVGNLTIKQDETKYMFFHHNGVKLDFTKINDKSEFILATDKSGKHVRLWGDPKWIIERTGRDIEKLLWKEATALWCQTEFGQVCNKMREVWSEVYM